MKAVLLFTCLIYLIQPRLTAQIEETSKGNTTLRIEKDGKFGFIEDQVLRIPIIYDSLPNNFSKEMTVGIGKNMGVIDYRGNTLVPIQYSSVHTVNNYSYGSFPKDGIKYIVGEQNKMVLLNSLGQELSPIRFDEVTQTKIFSNKLFEVKKDSLKGIIDSNAKTLLPCDFTRIESNYFERFSYQFGIKIIPAHKHNKSGVYFVKDMIWKELEFDEIMSIDTHWIIIKKNNKFNLLSNPELNYQFSNGYDNLSYLDYGEKYKKALFKYEENKLQGIIDLNGKKLSRAKYSSFKKTFKYKAEVEKLQLPGEIIPICLGVLENGDLELITLDGKSIKLGIK